MSRFTTITVRGLAAAALLAAPALADNGWAHLTPWAAPNAGPLQHFGTQTELDDEWAFVSARGEQQIHVWRRDGGTWSFFQTIDDPLGGDYGFGDATDLEGGVLYVGVLGADLVAQNAGAVHTFELVGGSWQHADTVLPITPDTNDRFGSHLDVNGDWMAVHAEGDGYGDRVHVFQRVAGQWTPKAELFSDASVTLGVDVAVAPSDDGESAVVLAGDPNANSHDGEVFSFLVNQFGWFPGPSVYPESELTGFGWAGEIEFDGEHLMVGAAFGAQQGDYTGEVAVYDIDDDVWPPIFDHAITLYPDIAQVDSRFGQFMDLDGDRLAVGAPGHFPNEVARIGAIHVFRPAVFGSGWVLEDILYSDAGNNGDWMGTGVAIHGDHVLGGGSFANNMTGTAVLFSLTPRFFPGGQAPNDVLATAEPYGLGKPGSLGIPELGATTAPVPGETALIGVSNLLEGTQPFLAWGFTPTLVPFDAGTLLVVPEDVITLPVATQFQQVGFGWDIPASPAISGSTIYAQAFVFDPLAGGPIGTAQSNGVALTIGY